MTTLLHWFTSPEWAQIVKTLLHSLWQGALIAVALAVFMRRLANPVSRYRCSLTALACVVVTGIFTWAVINSTEGRVLSPAQIPPMPEAQAAPNFAATMDANPENKIIVTAIRTPAATSMRWTAWLALVWLAGAAATLARAGVKVAVAEKLRRSCQPLNDARVEKLLAEARRAVGLARQVRVGVTDKLTSPAVVGVFVPMLILPLSLLTTLTPEQIHFVLLHELAHIRRGDYLANLFQFFAESLLFFNPAVWWISHQVRREREACCDALAIELSGAPVDYARTLVHVAENILQPAPAGALAFGDKREPSSLIDRVQRLLVPGYRPSLRLTWRAMLAALVLGSVLLVLSATGTRMTMAAILPSNSPIPPVINHVLQTNTTNQANQTSEERQALLENSEATTSFKAEWSKQQQKIKQASENLELLKKLLDVPDNYPVGWTNISREINSSYRPYLEAQQELERLGRFQNVLARKIEQLRLSSGIDSGLNATVAQQKPADTDELQLRTTFFKIDTYTGFANLQKLSGLGETNSLKEQLQKVLTEAGVKPPPAIVALSKDGMLVMRGTKEQRDLVYKVVMTLNGDPSNDSQTFTNDSRILTNDKVNAGTLLQDGKLLWEMDKLTEAEAKLKKALELDPQNYAAAYYLSLVHEARNKVATSRRDSDAQRSIVEVGESWAIPDTRARLPVPNPMVHTNLIYTGKGRQAIADKLKNIRLDSIQYDGVALSDVVSGLGSKAKALDSDGRGINFILNGTNITSLPITIQPALTNVTMADVLDAIVKNADKPIKYSIEDYAVVFSLRTEADLERLFVRWFKVDPNTFGSSLDKQPGLTGTNLSQKMRAVFSDAGVDLQSPKRIFYQDRTGVLIVRATKEDLEIVGTVLQALNYSPPQINIKVEFIELSQNGDSVYLGSVSMPVTNSPAGGVTPLNNPTVAFPFNPSGGSPINRNPQTAKLQGAKLQGILSPAQAKIAIAALKSNPRAVVAAQPEVTTLSGRQAQIQIVDVESILKGINPLALTPPGITVTTNNGPGAYLIEQMSFGPMLDVVAHASADEYTIHLTATLKVTAFLGYDNPGTNTTIYVNGKKQSVVPPLPHFYSDQTTVTNAVIWDGQTLVLGGLIREEVSKVKDKTPILGDLPLVGGMFRHESSNIVRKNLFVFITPTLIDPAGNRLHTDEDMPSAQNGVPVQAK